MEGTHHHVQSDDLNFKATELRLGLPGTEITTSSSPKIIININNNNNKRSSPDNNESEEEDDNRVSSAAKSITAPAPKAQIVGWPPVRSYRKNNTAVVVGEEKKTEYVKVSMDGAPFLRKIDLKLYNNNKNGYTELLNGLEKMFNFKIGSEYATAYEDKDGDLMLLGDVPWDMFMATCKRLRIMKGSDARGLGASAV
ncbi:hypothetical protein ABFS82_14G021900 [Erythranthe guttata]|uniref:Auxin-responsive protein n=1 Tax=Erythranthe guttata TaxID=4155 RepID=A0A022Q8Y1_ERYGU|nr:PREDICTED: auxin-responsive protein IAA4-like [Erythranthe guttata]EYU23713.1 hypothetical protein MIMGU_mgv1a014241mg [Erythranthe guttata]|eukprot:XP_012853986.1 PREDICTED: auxin-responsive protein IAA4-like [Erythranthe guttata]